MNRIVLWTQALRAPFFTASAMSVVVGSAAAWWAGAEVSWPLFAVTVIGVVALHAGANLTNDYYDHVSGNDAANRFYGPFSGGSRFIQDAVMPPRQYLRGAYIAFGVAIACGCAVYIEVGGWKVIALGLAGLFGGYLYTAPSLKFAYRGLGEIIVGLVFGPLATMGSYAVQAGAIGPKAFWSGVPVGLLVGLILIVNEVPDYEADKAAGKKTLVVRLGRSAGAGLAGVLYGATYALTYYAAWQRFAPKSILGTFATLPLAAFTVWWLWRHRYEPLKLRVSSAGGILTHLLFAIILTAAYLTARG
jgi:1,4-dihydroxy-2-naphthoate octaprenyltransferase